MKRWLVAAGALVAGAAVSAGLLVYSNMTLSSSEAFVAARALPAGAVVTADAIRLEEVRLGPVAALAFAGGDEMALVGKRVDHDIASGQLLQRSDLMGTQQVTDRRLVFVSLKDVPPVAPGEKVDLLSITGDPDHTAVAPFAMGLEVSSVASDGLVFTVTSKQAAALVFAQASMHLAAVVASADSLPGQEQPISSTDQAYADVR